MEYPVSERVKAELHATFFGGKANTGKRAKLTIHEEKKHLEGIQSLTERRAARESLLGGWGCTRR